MKTILLYFVILLSAHALRAQSSHIITAFDFGFAPEELTIMAGDTIVLENQGYHSITEVSEEDWNNNIGNSNGGFWIGFGASVFDNWFVLDDVGFYHYICMPHAAMGMKGTIEVIDPTVGISAAEQNKMYSISPTGFGQYLLRFAESDEFVVFTPTGQRMKTESLRGISDQVNLDLSHLAAGVYLGVFVENDKGVRVVKFNR